MLLEILSWDWQLLSHSNKSCYETLILIITSLYLRSVSSHSAEPIFGRFVILYWICVWLVLGKNLITCLWTVFLLQLLWSWVRWLWKCRHLIWSLFVLLMGFFKLFCFIKYFFKKGNLWKPLLEVSYSNGHVNCDSIVCNM